MIGLLDTFLFLVIISLFFIKKDTRKLKKRITLSSCELIANARPEPGVPSYKLKLKPENCKLELLFNNGLKITSKQDGRELHSFYRKSGVSAIIDYLETDIMIFNIKIKTLRSLNTLQLSYKKVNLNNYNISNF